MRRPPSIRPVVAVALLTALVLTPALAGCTTTPEPTTTEPTTSGGSAPTSANAPTATVSTAAASTDPSLPADPFPPVPERTITLRSGSVAVRVTVPADALTSTSGSPGARLLTVNGIAPTRPVRVVAARPRSADLTVQADGSVAVTAHGRVVGGLADPSRISPEPTTATGTADGSVELRTPGMSLAVWLGDGTPRSATWGTAEGGRSLAVDPSSWARLAGLTGAEATWSALVARHPDADTAGMHDQLLCHALGAQDKETWNLEPWRPDVGLVATVAARCNP